MSRHDYEGVMLVLCTPLQELHHSVFVWSCFCCCYYHLLFCLLNYYLTLHLNFILIFICLSATLQLPCKYYVEIY